MKVEVEASTVIRESRSRRLDSQKPPHLAILLHEGLDDANPREHAHQGRGLLSHRLPVMVIARLEIAGEIPAPGEDERHGQHRNDGQFRIEPEEHDADAHQLKRLEEEAAGHVVDQRVEVFRIIGHLAHQGADLLAVVEGQGEFIEFSHQVVAEIGGERGADAAGDDALPHRDAGGRQSGQEQDADDGQQEQRQLLLGILGEADVEHAVHQEFLQQGRDHVDGGRPQRERQQQDDAAAKGAEEAEQPRDRGAAWAPARRRGLRAAPLRPSLEVPRGTPRGGRRGETRGRCGSAWSIGLPVRSTPDRRRRAPQDIDPPPVQPRLEKARADGRLDAEAAELVEPPLAAILPVAVNDGHLLPLGDHAFASGASIQRDGRIEGERIRTFLARLASERRSRCNPHSDCAPLVCRARRGSLARCVWHDPRWARWSRGPAPAAARLRSRHLIKDPATT